MSGRIGLADIPPYRRCPGRRAGVPAACPASPGPGQRAAPGHGASSGKTDGLLRLFARLCHLPAGTIRGIFSPCRLLVTLDTQNREVPMPSPALPTTETLLAALKDILLRHLPALEIRPSPIDGLVLVRREDPPAPGPLFRKAPGVRHRPGEQALAHRLAGIHLPAGAVPGLRHRHAQLVFLFRYGPRAALPLALLPSGQAILTDLMLRMRPAGQSTAGRRPRRRRGGCRTGIPGSGAALGRTAGQAGADRHPRAHDHAGTALPFLRSGPWAMCCAGSMPRDRRTARCCRPSPSCAGTWAPRYAWRRWHGRWACPCPRSTAISRPSPA